MYAAIGISISLATMLKMFLIKFTSFKSLNYIVVSVASVAEFYYAPNGRYGIELVKVLQKFNKFLVSISIINEEKFQVIKLNKSKESVCVCVSFFLTFRKRIIGFDVVFVGRETRLSN